MADVVRNQNVTTLRRRYRPRPIHSAGQEKNRSDDPTTEKAEGPVARGNRGFLRETIRSFHRFLGLVTNNPTERQPRMDADPGFLTAANTRE